MEFSNRYIVGFTVALCLACSAAVSALAVGLKDRQDENKRLDMARQIVQVAGLVDPGAKVTPEEVNALFENIEQKVIDRRTGEVLDIDPDTFDPRKAAKDPSVSTETPDYSKKFKPTQVKRLPDHLEIYVVNAEGQEAIVLPIHGYGLWTTLYGFIALKRDLSEVIGITYYEHGETPGLGGEVDNPGWKAQWPGKVPFDAEGALILEVLKAGAPQGNPGSQIDGLSGATITTVGVDKMLELWLGEHGYGPYLETLR